MARFYMIALLAFLAITFIAIGLGLYYYSKRVTINGIPLIEEPINEEKRTEKMGLVELLIYLSMIGAAALYVFSVRGGSPILGRLILLPPVMAFFNARKRTGKALLALLVTFMVAFF